ncbi:unnamed protein product [Camellia sinensis]
MLSYDYLPDEESKSCLLLCVLFPEEANVSVEILVGYDCEKLEDIIVKKNLGKEEQEAIVDKMVFKNLKKKIGTSFTSL